MKQKRKQTAQNDIYKKNINAILRSNPKLAAKIFSIKTNEKFSVFMGKDPLDINIIAKDGSSYVYENPLKDTHKMLNEFEKKFARYANLFFYGMGNGVLLKALLQNKAHQCVVVFEPEIEILYIAFSLIDFSKDILSGRFRVFNALECGYNELYELCQIREIRPYVKLYDIHIMSKFYDNYAQNLITLNQEMTRAIKQMVLTHGNDTTDALIGIAHHIRNLGTMLTNLPLSEILRLRAGKCKNAVVVSTGPSLTKQLPLLKEFAPYVSIISVDASLPILQQAKIAPDYVVSIERVEYTSRFFLNLDKELLKNTIFILPSLTHEKSVENLQGLNLAIVSRPLNFFQAFKLDDFGYIGIGSSASNSAYELSVFLKHKNVALIGQDLAFSDDGKSHAGGHIFGENEKSRGENALLTTRYGGEGLIATTWIWNMFRNSFELAINEADEIGIKTYNCTQGGSRINGAVEMKFSEFLDKFVSKQSKNLEKITKFDDKKIKILAKKAYDKFDDIDKYTRNLIQKVEKLFLQIADDTKKYEELYLNGDKTGIDYDKIASMIKKIDKIKDEVESDKFAAYCTDAAQAYIYQQELDLAKLAVEHSKTDEEKKDKMLKWVVLHRYWLFSLAGALQSQLNAISTTQENFFEFLKSIGIKPKI